MKRQTAVRQSSLNSAPLFIALFSILLPSRLVALDLDPVRVGGYDTSGFALGVAVSGNYAFSGGGIYNSAGTVTVSDDTLSGNGARFGGGIYNSGGTVTVSNGSTLSDNLAYHADYPWTGGDGGGLYNDGGTVTISNSTLSGNTADVNFGRGGGLYNNSGTATVENSSSITGNTASDLGPDALNLGVLYLDSTSTIGVLDGNPAISF